MSDDHNYFEFHDEESWVSDWDFGRNSFDICHCQWMCHCECECDHATTRPTTTLAKKANCSSLIWDCFSTLTLIQNFKWTPYWQREGYCWDWWILNDIEIALRNAHFRYRGSIEYRDTPDGIVIVAPISGIAQHYCTHGWRWLQFISADLRLSVFAVWWASYGWLYVKFSLAIGSRFTLTVILTLTFNFHFKLLLGWFPANIAINDIPLNTRFFGLHVTRRMYRCIFKPLLRNRPRKLPSSAK